MAANFGLSKARRGKINQIGLARQRADRTVVTRFRQIAKHHSLFMA
jgi:hypothetical protein